MTLISPNEGDALNLKIMIGNDITQGANRKLHLFTSNTTPANATVLGDLTECAAAGYAAITLAGGSWSVSTVGNVTTASYAEQTFTLTAASTVYGYYVTDSGSTKILWIEKFPAAYAFGDDGGSVAVTPKITLN